MTGRIKNSRCDFFHSDISYLPTYCRCIGLLSHKIKLDNTHTHTHTHTYSVGLHLTRNRSVLEISTRIPRNTHKRQTSMPPSRFETKIPASERPPESETRLDTATGIEETERNCFGANLRNCRHWMA